MAKDSIFKKIFEKYGIKISDTFSIVKKFKKTKNSKPCILMGYYNSIIQYGENNFIRKCKQVGVDGLIIVDLPWPENKIFAKTSQQKLEKIKKGKKKLLKIEKKGKTQKTQKT